MGLELHLFGRPRAIAGEDSFDLAFERRHQLLAYLAIKRSWVPRTEVAALLWPDIDGKLAHANLRKTLFRLAALPWAPQVESQSAALRFDVATDVGRFEAALREGRVAEALAFPATDFLAGFDGEGEAWSAWLGFERERLRAAWRTAAIARMESGGDPAEALAISARMLDADPFDEDAVRAHMRLLADAGQVTAARRVYRDFAQRLEKEFSLVPGAELQSLHSALSESSPRAAPAALPSGAVDTGFIGRSSELRQIGDTLAAGECRMLCIVGPGGVGKTRLARRVLQEFGSRYADGTVFVPLEDATSPGQIGAAIARELGLALSDLDEAIAYLRDRRMLVVLDNFEQIAHTSHHLERVLRECPQLHVIVTSRVRLGLKSEWSLPLEGLPCPDPEDADRLDAFDAARLFVRSAKRVEPTFVPTAEAPAIIAICREVEGLPLALELAASWTRVLSCEAIAAELREGTQLLRADDPGWPARHGSMEIVFEQSWAMLGDAEREALARLSVFRGGFTAHAASRVANAALPVLASLTDKSLLRKEGQRLNQHPLIQQLSALRLDPGELGETQAAHARYFHELLEQLGPMAMLGERDALARIDAEFENCRAAWEWSASHGDIAGMLRSVGTLRQYCEHRGRSREGLVIVMPALEIATTPVASATLRANVAQMQYRLDRYAEALATAHEALDALHGLRERMLRIACLRVIGTAYLRLSRRDEARRALLQALSIVPDSEPRTRAVILDTLSLIEKRRGRYDDAMHMSLRALEQFRAAGYIAAEALCLNNLGALQIDRGEFEGAKSFLQAALQLSEHHGLVNTRIYALANLAEACLEAGDYEGCRRWSAVAIDGARAAGNRAVESNLHMFLARAAIRQGDPEGARAQLHKGAQIANAIARPGMQFEALMCLGELLATQRESRAASVVLHVAANDPATSELDRARIRKLQRTFELDPDPKGDLPTFVELAQRIESETPAAHAPLIAALRAG